VAPGQVAGDVAELRGVILVDEQDVHGPALSGKWCNVSGTPTPAVTGWPGAFSDGSEKDAPVSEGDLS
jgi:hypothetical protein